ncbi:MAG: UvrD-helicase domain-containing protein [Desulfobulbaceae bacterium]
MRYIADLHIHSLFSRATSKTSHLQGLAAWAAVKGIQVVGTGDFTHPGWLRQIAENLTEAEPGFHRLKPERCAVPDGLLPPGVQVDISTLRFVLTAEISSIYKRGGAVRKVHNILFAPDLASVRRINSVLAGIGNLEADGRPILGLDSRDLLEIVLENAPQGFLVPAHIWTPWFSLFGSKSGFDAIEECFGDLSHEIFALETGLSSDPDMNRLISALDRFTLISNSDCHSPAKLGREANILTTGFDFPSLREALRRPVSDSGEQRFAATIEFYPEEGKYHADGHRKCGVSMEPPATRQAGGICPVCRRPLTVGVLNRVMELADRNVPRYPPGAPKVHSLVPLAELLGEMLDAGPATKGVTGAYGRLIRQYGSELALLLTADIGTVADETSPHLAEAIERVRSGRVIRTAGYDGEYGKIRVFSEEERRSFGGQRLLFGEIAAARPTRVRRVRAERPGALKEAQTEGAARVLNPEQQAAVTSLASHILVKAGPGTGKTHTLVQRVVRLVREGQTPCTVITFTNRAADELRDRLVAELRPETAVFIGTLHGYCLRWLRREQPGLQVAGPEQRRRLLRLHDPGMSEDELADLERQLHDFLEKTEDAAVPPPALFPYFTRLRGDGLIDIDQVVPAAQALLREDGAAAAAMRMGTGHLLVDEFQDLSESQYRLILTLAATSPVFAIGDPDQAIYGFRGSSPRWFFQFASDMAAEQHVLRRNYRSGAAIVAAAGALIAHNRRPESRIGNEATSAPPGRLHEICVDSSSDEAAFLVRRIESLIGGSSHREIDRLGSGGDAYALGDIAVLYRTGRQAEPLARELAEHGFPVQVVDLRPFYLTGPTFELYLWVLLAAGRLDGAGLLALLGKEKGIGGATLSRVEQLLAGGGEDPWPVVLAGRSALPAGAVSRLAEMDALLGRIRESAAGKGLVPALRLAVAHHSLSEDNEEIVRLLRMAETFGSSLSGFADHLQRYSDSVVYDQRADAVTLMTLHAAKGLEFRAVFLVGVEEGLLPLAPRGRLSPEEEAEHLEEERRLFYVGMTRAREMLCLSHARSRFMDGHASARQPSRFLREIPGSYFTSLDGPLSSRRRKSAGRQLSLF